MRPSNLIEFIQVKLKSFPVFFCSLFFLYTACTKISSTEIGTGLIPAVDGVNTKDTTITVYAKNTGDTTISPLITETHVVGNIDDPLFGITDARINFQVLLPNDNFKFEANDNIMLDSVVLVLGYRGIWGDSTRPVLLHVNELEPDLPFLQDTLFDAYGYKALYNTSFNFPVSNSLTTTPAVIDPRNLDDTMRVFRDSGINMIRIKLNDAFGIRLLTNYDTSNAFKSDSAFKTALRGLQVYADPGSNSLLKIGLTDPNTKLALYYKYHPKDSAAAKIDTSVTYFTVDQLNSAHSNNIVRNRSSGQINDYLGKNPDTPNDNLVFIQAGPGTYATVTVEPGALAKLSNVIVHRAELLLEQAKDPASDTYNTPPYLFLVAKGDTSRFVIPGYDSSSIATADAVFSSSYLSNYSSFGGVPSQNTSNNSLYSFNISRYVQGIVSKNNNEHPFIIYAPYNEPLQLLSTVPFTTVRGYVTTSPVNAAGCGRVRLYGGGDAATGGEHRMRLHIVYSLPH